MSFLGDMKVTTRIALTGGALVAGLIASLLYTCTLLRHDAALMDDSARTNATYLHLIDISRESQVDIKKQVQEWKAASDDLLARNHSDVQQTMRYATIIFLVFIAFVSILGFIVLKSISTPLLKLLKYSREVSTGNYNVTCDYSSNNEIGQLAAEISEMVHTLKEKLGFAQGILNGINVPCVVSDKNCTISFVNRAVIDLIEIGGNPEEYLGMTTGTFFYNEPRRQTITGKVCTENRIMTNAMVDVTTRKGRVLHCRIDAAPVTDLDGKVIAGIALITDLTEVVSQRKLAQSQAEKITMVAQEADDISHTLDEASHNLSGQVDLTSSSAADQEIRISEAASAMEEMNATIVEVAKSAGQAADIASRAKEKAREGASIVGKVIQGIDEIQRESMGLKDDMGALGKQAEAIGQIMNVISDIADQTNLLALNAAIEAARAGDAGRGFAVVADEVRKLAEKTMSATKEVGDAIQGIQQGTRKNIESVDRSVRNIDEVTGLSGSSGQALDEIVSLVDQTTHQVQSIAAASDEQSAASEEIARLLDDIHKLTVETAEAMKQSTREVTALAQQTQELKHLIESMQTDETAALPRLPAPKK